MTGMWRKRGRRKLKTGGMAIWAAFISLFLLWQIVEYRGAMAILAEWEFNTFGRYFPSFTYLFIVLLLASPGLLLFRRLKGEQSDRRFALATLRSALIFRRMLFGVSGLCALIALGSLLLTLFLPNGRGQGQDLDLSKPVINLPRQGLTTITGAPIYERTSAFDEDLLVTHRELRFAPIVPPDTTTNDLQFFVELPPQTDQHADVATSFTGTLRKNALPGEILRLYRYAGYRVEPPYYVLFSKDTVLRWPYYEVAIELLIIGVIFLAAGLWQHRRAKRIEAEIQQAHSA